MGGGECQKIFKYLGGHRPPLHSVLEGLLTEISLARHRELNQYKMTHLISTKKVSFLIKACSSLDAGEISGVKNENDSFDLAILRKKMA